MMPESDGRLPIYSVTSDEFERVNVARSQWRLHMIKIRVKSFQKWLPIRLGYGSN